MRVGAIEPEPERRKVPAFFRFIGTGLLRLAAYIAVAAAISSALGIAWGLVSNSDDLVHSAALGLYVGGSAMLAMGLLTGGRTVQYRGALGENLGTIGGPSTGAFALVGVFVVVLGVIVDSYL